MTYINEIVTGFAHVKTFPSDDSFKIISEFK